VNPRTTLRTLGIYVHSLRLMLRLYRRARLLDLPFDMVLYQHLLWKQEQQLLEILASARRQVAEAARRN
jgi:hypothetical protein